MTRYLRLVTRDELEARAFEARVPINLPGPNGGLARIVIDGRTLAAHVPAVEGVRG